ncbi:glycosyltransferase family 61 protein [archaeon]|nr:MAG: glycosyltransferase family 61 protein [archaeon]
MFILFTGREDEYKRRLTNMKDVQGILDQFQVTVHYPNKAQMSFGDTVHMLHHTRLLIAPSGTGFSGNVPFLNPNTSVIVELFPRPIHTSTGAIVAKYRKFKYYIPLICLHKDPDVVDGILVNITHLRLGLHLARQYLHDIERVI